MILEGLGGAEEELLARIGHDQQGDETANPAAVLLPPLIAAVGSRSAHEIAADGELHDQHGGEASEQ
ncbi:MAG: hypothetical protein QNI91_11685 [Arenicellales bacterium]|nr:hypothetical protein [Arenicellales bacterium]